MSALRKDEHDPVLIDMPLPIVTPRLILRPLIPGDGAATAEAVAETWDDLHRWMDWATAKPTPEECEARARRVYAQFILREDFGFIGLKRGTGWPVVWTGLHCLDWTSRKFYTGYWVRKSAQGRGYAAEACNALTRYAFEVLEARRVEITHSDGNEPSRSIIHKLGFEKEGVRRGGTLLPSGVMADSHVYARLSPEGLPPLDVRWGPP
jgi:RimJ/RimL family protein N-acetyltransferase